MRLSIVCPAILLGLCMGKSGRFTLVLNKICTPRVGNLSWPLIWPLTIDLLVNEHNNYGFKVFLSWVLEPCGLFQKNKSPYNLLSETMVRKGFDHLIYLKGRVFDYLFGQILTLPTQFTSGDIVGLTIDRYIYIIVQIILILFRISIYVVLFKSYRI